VIVLCVAATLGPACSSVPPPSDTRSDAPVVDGPRDGGPIDTTVDVDAPLADASVDGVDAGSDGGDADAPPPLAPGSPCTANQECGLGADCLDEAAWKIPGGYCAPPCNPARPVCPEGSLCTVVEHITEQGTDVQQGYCLATCTDDSQCREGFGCRDRFMFSQFLAPLREKVCAPGDIDAPVGAPCTAPTECRPGNGVCLNTRAGYCTVACQQEDREGCAAGETCYPLYGPTYRYCLPSCPTAGGPGCEPGSVCAQRPGSPPGCVPASATARIGDACEFYSEDCGPGQFCGLVASTGLVIPGGMCTSRCNPAVGCSDPEAECVSFTVGSQTLCVPKCTSDAECRPGWRCVEGFSSLQTVGTVCAPGVAEAVPLGHECVDDSQCQAGVQGCQNEWLDMTGGACSRFCDPADSDVCGPDGFCSPGFFCLAACDSDDDCAARRTPGSAGTYGCSDRWRTVALPERGCIAYDPGARFGDPCEHAGQCPLGTYCITDDPLGFPRFMNGYCTDSCDPLGPPTCGEGATCYNPGSDPRQGVCARTCTGDQDCRTEDNYVCYAVSVDTSACLTDG
jgi:hypothetical protein